MGLRKTQLSANNGPAQRPPKVSLGCAGSSKTTHQSGTHCERCRKADRADRCAYATAIAVPSSPVAARFISVPRGGSVPTVHDAKQRSRRNGNPGFTNQGEGGGGATKQHCRCLSASDDVGCRNRCTAASAAGLARWCRRLHDHVEMLFRVNVEPGAAADLQEQRRAGEETYGEGSLGEALLRPSLGGVVLPSPPPSSTSAGVEGSVGRVDSREDESLMCHAHAREENEEEKNSWGSSRWTTPSVTGARTATCDQCLLRKYGLSSTCTCAFCFLWRLAYAYAADGFLGRTHSSQHSK